jgi:hypothetical protein
MDCRQNDSKRDGKERNQSTCGAIRGGSIPRIGSLYWIVKGFPSGSSVHKIQSKGQHSSIDMNLEAVMNFCPSSVIAVGVAEPLLLLPGTTSTKSTYQYKAPTAHFYTSLGHRPRLRPSQPPRAESPPHTPFRRMPSGLPFSVRDHDTSSPP